MPFSSLVLLHGLTTSSRTLRKLIPTPDYPGFGHSAFPPADEFEYSFANLTGVVERFIEVVGLGRFQQYFRDHQPPMLITWGKNDEITS